MAGHAQDQRNRRPRPRRPRTASLLHRRLRLVDCGAGHRPDHAGQVQAFGIADLGMGRELGYISIPELLENGAEIDLYFKPQPIGDLLA